MPKKKQIKKKGRIDFRIYDGLGYVVDKNKSVDINEFYYKELPKIFNEKL